METLVVELTDKNALQLLRGLESLDIIRLHDIKETPREAGEDLVNHVKQVRSEWGNI
jgi:hypothetical protein